MGSVRRIADGAEIGSQQLTIVVPGTPAAQCAGEAATIVGTAGVDTIVGTPGRDVIQALDGDDQVSGLEGNDVICGGKKTTTCTAVLGETGSTARTATTLFAGSGNDQLVGGAGEDELGAAPATIACRAGAGTMSSAATTGTTSVGGGGPWQRRAFGRPRRRPAVGRSRP